MPIWILDRQFDSLEDAKSYVINAGSSSSSSNVNKKFLFKNATVFKNKNIMYYRCGMHEECEVKYKIVKDMSCNDIWVYHNETIHSSQRINKPIKKQFVLSSEIKEAVIEYWNKDYTRQEIGEKIESESRNVVKEHFALISC
jgi:hypothetical protein